MDSSFREYASSSPRKGDSTFKEGEMTKEDIVRMAREAGGYLAELPKGDAWLFTEDEYLERFAALVASAEREACAKVCDAFQARDVGMQPAECAGAIRARGQA